METSKIIYFPTQGEMAIKPKARTKALVEENKRKFSIDALLSLYVNRWTIISCSLLIYVMTSIILELVPVKFANMPSAKTVGTVQEASSYMQRGEEVRFYYIDFTTPNTDQVNRVYLEEAPNNQLAQTPLYTVGDQVDVNYNIKYPHIVNVAGLDIVVDLSTYVPLLISVAILMSIGVLLGVKNHRFLRKAIIVPTSAGENKSIRLLGKRFKRIHSTDQKYRYNRVTYRVRPMYIGRNYTGEVYVNPDNPSKHKPLDRFGLTLSEADSTWRPNGININVKTIFVLLAVTMLIPVTFVLLHLLT